MAVGSALLIGIAHANLEVADGGSTGDSLFYIAPSPLDHITYARILKFPRF